MSAPPHHSPFAQPPLPPLPPLTPVGRRRRHPVRRALWWTGVLVAVVVLGVGVLVAVSGFYDTDSPATVVRKYFAALAEGKAATALSLGAAPRGDTRFLTDAALEQRNRVASISVTVRGERIAGDDARVSVRLAAGQGTPVDDTIALRRRSRHWSLVSTSRATTVKVTAAARRVTLAGQPLPSRPVLLFPGPVPLSADTPALSADADDPIVTLTGPARVELSPVVTKRGAAAVRDGLQAAMQGCLSLAARAPAYCPLQAIGSASVPGTVRGRLTGDGSGPTIELVDGDQDGLLRVSGQFEVDGTTQHLDFENQTTTETGSLDVPFHARVYVTAPTVVQWRDQ